MEEKEKLLKDIKELWNDKSFPEFEIAPELLEYLELDDLIELKTKILNSQSFLSPAQKEWLAQFRKE